MTKGNKVLFTVWSIMFVYGWSYYLLVDSPFNHSPAESIAVFFAGMSIVFSTIFLLVVLMIYIMKNW